MTQLSEDFFLEISEAMRMSEKQSAGNGNEDRKGQPCTAGSHATRLHAPFEDSQGNDKHGKKNDAAALRDPQESPRSRRGQAARFSGSLSKKRNAERPKKASGQCRAQETFPACAASASNPIERTTMPAQ